MDTFIDWANMKVVSLPADALPETPCGRIEFIHRLLNFPVFDADGNDTGETCELISRELAAKLLDKPYATPPSEA